jgi:hypothetical protein
MIDFQRYLEPLGNEIDVFDDEFESVSPFAPIEIGSYVLHLFASEEDLCEPRINSLNPYTFSAWEVMIEKKHKRYDMAVVTHIIFRELGFEGFENHDVYAGYVPSEIVQDIFNHLVNKIKLPKIKNITYSS